MRSNLTCKFEIMLSFGFKDGKSKSVNDLRDNFRYIQLLNDFSGHRGSHLLDIHRAALMNTIGGVFHSLL